MRNTRKYGGMESFTVEHIIFTFDDRIQQYAADVAWTRIALAREDFGGWGLYARELGYPHGKGLKNKDPLKAAKEALALCRQRAKELHEAFNCCNESLTA